MSNKTKNTGPAVHSLIHSAGIMGFLTAVSRVLGFVRDGMIAVFYGTSVTAQAFVVAFRIPNLLRDLVGEGAANTAFVPVFSRVRTLEGEESWAKLAQAVWMRVLAGTLVISVIGVFAAPWLVRIIAPGFHSDPELVRQTTLLTRILFPFIGLVAITAFLMGLLNSLHHFALPSLGPSVLNICMIAGLFAWRPNALGLAIGILVGGFLQILIQLPFLRKSGVHLNLRWEPHPGLRQIGRMMIPRVVGSGVYQISVLVDNIFASFSSLVGSGGIAALYFATRFLHLPLALFGISVAQAALPTLSAHAAVNEIEPFKKTVFMALRSSLFIAFPSAFGLMMMGRPIIQTLLQHGHFTGHSTDQTVSALTWYATGLAAMCASKVLINAFYAFHDTWTPVKSASIALGLNILFNAALIFPMGLGGLALATSLSGTWNAMNLYVLMKRRLNGVPDGFERVVVKMLAASAAMGIVSRLCWEAGSGWIPSHPAAVVVLLAVTLGIGVTVFFGLALLLKIEEAGQLLRWVYGKLSGSEKTSAPAG